MLHLVYSCFDIVSSYGIILYCYKIQFFSKDFLFLAISKSFRVRFRLFVAWNVHIVGFSSHFCFLVIFVQLMLVLFVLLLVTVISLSWHFLCCFFNRFIDVPMLSSVLVSPPSLFFLQFAYVFMHRCFLSGLFVEVLPSSTLRMVSSILRMGQPRCLSLWWVFCYVVWFPVVFLFSWGILLNFSFHLCMLDDVRFQFSEVFVSFLFSVCSDFLLI